MSLFTIIMLQELNEEEEWLLEMLQKCRLLRDQEVEVRSLQSIFQHVSWIILSESTAVARHELGTPWTQIRMFYQSSEAAQSQPQSQSRSLYWLTYLLLTRLVVYTIYKWTMQLMLIYELIQVQNLSTPYTVNTFHTYMLEYYNNCLINTQFIECTRITVFFLNISHPL